MEAPCGTRSNGVGLVPMLRTMRSPSGDCDPGADQFIYLISNSFYLHTPHIIASREDSRQNNWEVDPTNSTGVECGRELPPTLRAKLRSNPLLLSTQRIFAGWQPRAKPGDISCSLKLHKQQIFSLTWQFSAAIVALCRCGRKEMNQTRSSDSIFSRRWIIWLNWGKFWFFSRALNKTKVLQSIEDESLPLWRSSW